MAACNHPGGSSRSVERGVRAAAQCRGLSSWGTAVPGASMVVLEVSSNVTFSMRRSLNRIRNRTMTTPATSLRCSSTPSPEPRGCRPGWTSTCLTIGSWRQCSCCSPRIPGRPSTSPRAVATSDLDLQNKLGASACRTSNLRRSWRRPEHRVSAEDEEEFERREGGNARPNHDDPLGGGEPTHTESVRPVTFTSRSRRTTGTADCGSGRASDCQSLMEQSA